MPKKRVQRKSAKRKTASSKPFIVYRQYIIALSAVVIGIGLYVFSQTQSFYFFSSSKERVDFVSETGEYDPTKTVAVFEKKSLSVPDGTIHTARKDVEAGTSVLGDSTSQKRIEIDLTNQRLYAIENGTRVYDFPVSTGKPQFETPKGSYRVWIKLRYVHMRGGSQAMGTSYDLPNVPYTLFFANEAISEWKGFGIYGSYWHEKFGEPMSHGGIAMEEEDAAQIYYWAEPNESSETRIRATEENPGTEVLIYGTTPQS